MRRADTVSRLGGDEFAVLMSETAEHQVDGLLARLARAHPAPWTAGAVLCEDDESLTQAIERADARLYVAKAPQRDRRDSEREALAVGAPQEDMTQRRVRVAVQGVCVVALALIAVGREVLAAVLCGP